jgi:hypothetical protein
MNTNIDYISFCNALHKSWYECALDTDNELNGLFQMEYSPEPYFTVDAGKNPLYMLLTNPGSGMDFQHRSNFNSSNYPKFSETLSTVYLSESFKNNAKRRLINSIQITKELGYTGLINIETIPFHSPNLNKSIALKLIGSNSILSQYTKLLQEFLFDKPILIVSACQSRSSVSAETILKSNWLRFKLGIAGINPDDLIMRPLTYKGEKITSAIFSHSHKHLVLMMGTNNLPSVENFKKLK